MSSTRTQEMHDLLKRSAQRLSARYRLDVLRRGVDYFLRRTEPTLFSMTQLVNVTFWWINSFTAARWRELFAMMESVRFSSFIATVGEDFPLPPSSSPNAREFPVKAMPEHIYANQNLFYVFVTLWLPNIRIRHEKGNPDKWLRFTQKSLPFIKKISPMGVQSKYFCS